VLGKIEVLRENHVTLPLCRLLIPYGLVWIWTWGWVRGW